MNDLWEVPGPDGPGVSPVRHRLEAGAIKKVGATRWVALSIFGFQAIPSDHELNLQPSPIVIFPPHLIKA
jgi:hypothetical protein